MGQGPEWRSLLEGWILKAGLLVLLSKCPSLLLSLPAQDYYGTLAWALPALGPQMAGFIPSEMASAFDRQGLGLCAGHWPVLWSRPEVTLQTTASPV